MRLGAALVMDSILTASRGAAQSAGLSEQNLRGAHAGLGLAGAALTSACDRLLEEPHPFASAAIETDAYAAWLGAHGGSDGAILILGTGSCGLAVVGGKQFYVSGWGAEVSDEASGQMLGREAIRRTLWAYDGRAPMTPLARAMLARFGDDAEKILAFATDARPADYGRLAQMVFEHAAEREPLALALVTEAAADAVRMISRLLDARGAIRLAARGAGRAALRLAAAADPRPPVAAARRCAGRGDPVGAARAVGGVAGRRGAGIDADGGRGEPHAVGGARGASGSGASPCGERRNLPCPRPPAATERAGLRRHLRARQLRQRRDLRQVSPGDQARRGDRLGRSLNSLRLCGGAADEGRAFPGGLAIGPLARSPLSGGSGAHRRRLDGRAGQRRQFAARAHLRGCAAAACGTGAERRGDQIMDMLARGDSAACRALGRRPRSARSARAPA